MAQGDNLSVEFLRAQLERYKRQSGGDLPPNPPSDGGGAMTASDSRIGKLEGVVEGLRHGQTLTFAGIGLVVALLLGASIYTFNKLDGINTRMDSLNEKVNALPKQIGSELRDITKTLAEAITASKQAPTQVILLPAPQPKAPDQPEKKP